MAHYRVKWYDDPRDPRSSYWYTLDGVITSASGLLQDWVGGDHKALVRYLHRQGRDIHRLGRECVPPTLKYHRELLVELGALVAERDRLTARIAQLRKLLTTTS